MPSCVECSSVSVWSNCATGFDYNWSSCAICAQFCLSCASGACMSVGHYSNGLQCIKCSSVLPNCLTYSTATSCSKCPDCYFSTDSNGCLLYSSVLAGCKTCALALALITSTCDAGFYLSGSTCRNCTATVSPACCAYFTPNCSVCKNNTACTL